MFDKHKETEEIWRPPYITSGLYLQQMPFRFKL